MATPKPKSYEQYLGDMLASFLAKTGTDDINTGSVTTSLFETVSLALARSSGDIFQILRDLSVDRAEGESLRRIATDEGLNELPARVASGDVVILDTSFQKIATKIYAGDKPPNIGSTLIKISDGSQFPVTGSVYLGRGTPNIEGPISYSSILPVGGFWQITLTAPTTKFHNINENVVLSQGGTRNIPVGTIVRAPASGASPDVLFSVTQSALILDGEVEVAGVQVSAQEPGSIGNVPIGAIKEFSSVPFSGASVKNTRPFKTGRDVETDEELRIRIKRARLSRGLGTALAIQNSVIGATPADEAATITSSQILSTVDQTSLFIDDGTGYEQKVSGVGIEFLVDSALGGETYFQLETGGRQSSVAKAYLLSELTAPFDIVQGDTLAISVGGIATEHVFQNSDFISPGGVTAYEIVASINGNSNLNWQANTSAGGTKVLLFAKEESNEDIQIEEPTSGRDVAEILGLPANQSQTLRLFKNKKPLSKDGNTARIETEEQVSWSPSIATGDTLTLAVDGTAPITYTFLDADFIAEGTYPAVSSTNSLESWVNVFNSKITGVTASVVGEQINLVSNLGSSNRASLSINPASTLVSKGMFSVAKGLLSQGKQADYKFSRNTAQIKLNVPLAEGDQLTAGTDDTEGRIESDAILGGVITLSGNANLWVLSDDKNAAIVNTGVVSDTLIAVAKPSANIVRYTSNDPSAFSTVQIGDYVIVWSEELSASNRLEGRVHAVSGANLDIKVTATEYAAAVVESGIIFNQGFAVVRSHEVPQKLRVTAGTKTLSDIAEELNLQAKGVQFSSLDEEFLIAKTLTKSSNGHIMIVSFDENGKQLSFTAGQSDTSNESLIASYETSFTEGEFPLFFHSEFASGSAALPPDSYLTAAVSVLSPSLDPNFLIGYAQPFGNILDAMSPNEKTVVKAYSGANLTLEQDPFIKRLRTDDRYYAVSPLDFGHDDELVTIIDNDPANKTFSIPLFRIAETNSTLAVNPTSFNAYDIDGGATNSFTTYFGTSFDFSDFKALMKAKNVIDPAGNENAILYRAVRYGRSGENIKVGYTYPSSPNQDIGHSVQINDEVQIAISLKSGVAIPTTLDGTTEWDVTITPNTPVAGVDQVTFTWTGTGSAPNLAVLSGGEYVNITQESEFDKANTGVYRVSDAVGFTPTATSFSIQKPNGEAVTQSNAATLVPEAITFYNSATTTAQEIVDYVNDNLTSFVTAEIVNDSGLTGAGNIELSTAEETDFASSFINLLDGINWIASSNLGGSPQFTFKQSLALPSVSGYAFNQGEEVVLVPTTLDHVARLSKILAVSGITTNADLEIVNRKGKLEIATKTVGGNGAVQIVGGLANGAETPVIDNSSVVNNSFIKTSIDSAGLSSLHSDQWIKLTASNKQAKETLFKSGTNIKIDPATPGVGQSTISLSNRTETDRLFGKPRHHIRTRGRTFKVEKQGSFTCISWDGNGSSPAFTKTVELNDSLGGTLNINPINGTSDVEYIILSGDTRFSEVSIGDLITISNMDEPENNGTFLVTGVAIDGTSVRVLNPNAVSEYSQATFTITNNADIAGDDFEVDGNILEAGVDFTVGATAADTAVNLASAISALPGVSAIPSANTVIVTATTSEASITISYTNNAGAAGATVSSATLIGRSFAAGDFVCSTKVTEGDTVEIKAPFNLLNRGLYRVIKEFNNSIYIDAPNSTEEYVALSDNLISLGFSGTTEFDIDTSNASIKMSWNGIGTEPQLGNAKMGDEITFGTDFDSDNQGIFMVIKSQPKKKEKYKILCSAGNQMTSGQYFLINSALDATEYYVWYNIDGLGGDPAPLGKTPIQININSTDSALQVASATAAALELNVDFTASASSNSVTVEAVGFGPTTTAVNVTVAGPFFITILQKGQWSFLEAINPKAVSETAITITDVLQCHRPAMLFSEYDASVAGDTFMVSTNFLGNASQGSFPIVEVLDQETIIVSGTMASVEERPLSPNEGSVLIQEQNPYTAYKKIKFVSTDGANELRGNVVLYGRENANKVNEDAGVQISTMNKLSFSTRLTRGIDSYKYHTGLIGEANRIVYGDPRDSATYRGVAAAGAEIFIKEPLTKRIQVSIDVRIETGIPFTQIVEQVRNNVAALIDSNEIGQSIAISDIVSTVNSIPGVRAVAISSPQYDAQNDIIRVNVGEKTRIIDSISDIAVSEIG